MLAMDDNASIFCARDIRGTASIAMTVPPSLAACSSRSGFPPGLKKLISVLPGPMRDSSSSPGVLTLATISACVHSVSASATTPTPAAS